MFRNPRENVDLPPERKALPSTGRPPSPPSSSSTTNSSFFPPRSMATKARAVTQKSSTTPKSTKAKVKPNGNIQAFFKKAEELNSALFVPNRFNESNGSIKRRKTEDLGDDLDIVDLAKDAAACSPPPPDPAAKEEDTMTAVVEEAVKRSLGDKMPKRAGPFIDDSDSDESQNNDPPPPLRHSFSGKSMSPKPPKAEAQTFSIPVPSRIAVDDSEEDKTKESALEISTLKREATSCSGVGDFEGFENLEDFADEEFEDGEEMQYRKFMDEQRRLELDDEEYESEFDPEDTTALGEFADIIESLDTTDGSGPACPICSIALSGVTDEQASVHVNNCLDGNPTPLPVQNPDSIVANKTSARKPALLPRSAKPPQKNPFTMAASASSSSPVTAFTKLMSNHAEDLAWKSAAASEARSRGKPAYERTCPFYKILPGFSICVDAFRYGAVEGCKAYFLSHFHSDHYIGLTSTWCHGPIYCSRVTGNLVRQQLRVDPKWVVDLVFEEEREVPGTDGARVTMIPANHCPGSSLFLFEKAMSKSKNAKVQRILHCGDFRACQAHIEHPILRPDIVCKVTGKTEEQKIDVCYLDTTYLNPKYAFPPQEHVIEACADMCVSLHKSCPDETDKFETMKRERAGSGMTQFLEVATKIKKEDSVLSENGSRGRLLVIVGTYSIGKERICVGIAKALKSKIYAPAGKQRICACLEDPELDALLTKNPREAQVHMTPLFEIRPETLEEYLNDYRDTFSRVVGFRPSGWNYRPPNSRFIESPPVSMVLYGANWKSSYSMKDLAPQRGSTKKASCFGVPYSEHSSFRELTMFCCSLRIEKVIPTVNVGSAKGREKMRNWVEKWTAERKKTGLFKVEHF